MSPSVVVRVPASTSNCGPGFDTLGIALNLYGSVRLSRRADDKFIYTGEAENFPAEATDMVREVAEFFYKETRVSFSGLDFDIKSEVPVARGLGSSIILRGGILAGLNELNGSSLKRDDLVRILSILERHPDNASAGILGGFTVARYCPESQTYLGTQRFSVDESLAFVVVAPDLEIKTDDSRTALPKEISFAKVVSSLNSLSYLVAAFASGNYEALAACRVDHLHQPYRFIHIPQAEASIQAGIVAGAYTGWLSGSGSSVLCVCKDSLSESVKSAMELSFCAASTNFASYILKADNSGILLEI